MSSNQVPTQSRHRAAWAPPAVAGALVCAIVCAAALAGMALRLDRGRGAFDEINYHGPTIRTFAAQWPRPDVSDYLSATTPGYHLLMAGVSRVVGDAGGTGGEWALRGVNLLITLVLVGGMAAVATVRLRRSGIEGWRGAVWGAGMTMPLAVSLYVLASAVWLLPENAAWVMVLACLGLALRISRGASAGALALAGIALVGLVLARQIHLWAAAPIWVAAWIGGAPGGAPAREGWLGCATGSVGSRARWAAAAVLATAPAFVVVGWFARMWGGLTPPTFAVQFQSLNAAGPAFILALIGLFSMFFAPLLAGPAARMWRERPAVLVLAIAAGVVAALIPETTYSPPDGRWTGLWNISRALEARGLVVMGRTSPLIVALAGLGGGCLAVWVRAAGPREGAVLLTALAGFAAAQLPASAWQRYLEPMLLMVLILLASGVGPGETGAEPGRIAGAIRRGALPWVVAASVAFGGQTFMWFRRAEPAVYYGFRPGDPRVAAFLRGEAVDPVPDGGEANDGGAEAGE